MKYWFQDELIFHEGSINSLKNKLEELIQNPEIMSTKSAILRKKIADKHTWDKVFEMEARVIKKIFQ